ncbi:MAG: ABC transporter substrate-binding protein [Limnochordia bacterium]|jgi:ABC-type glycerol-3-phosphate transport system substrate-binding protein
MKRKTLCSVVLTFLIIMGVVVCAHGQRIVHQSTAGHGANWLAWLQEMVPIFEAKTGLEVEVIQTAGSYGDALLAAIAAGVAPDVTDLIISTAGPFVEKELVEDLRPYFDRDRLDDSKWPPVAIQGNTTADGRLWRMPAELSTAVTYFNADMFRAAGLATPKELGQGWTWETLLTAARRLTIDRSGDGRPDQYGIADINITRWQTLVKQAGGSLFDRDLLPTTSYINTPPVLEATRFRLQFSEEGLLGGGGTWDGVSAMTFAVPGNLPRYQNAMFEWDVAVKPRGPVNRASSVNANGFQILADSKNKEAAWQWICFLTGDQDSQAALVKHTGRPPAYMPVLVRYGRVVEGIKLPANWMAFIETAISPDARTPYMIPDPEIDRTITRMMATVWSGAAAPESVLETLDRIVGSMLRQ